MALLGDSAHFLASIERIHNHTHHPCITTRHSHTLSQGLVALLGDSAHAMQPNLGQGGCMAIEDSHQLALDLESAMQQAQGDKRAVKLDRLLQRFTNKRVLRVSTIHGMAGAAFVLNIADHTQIIVMCHYLCLHCASCLTACLCCNLCALCDACLVAGAAVLFLADGRRSIT